MTKLPLNTKITNPPTKVPPKYNQSIYKELFCVFFCYSDNRLYLLKSYVPLK